ncbi:MAG: hypothetical protein ACJ749_18375 [Flavisolibacter sp.]|jgi:hypothetical protein
MNITKNQIITIQTIISNKGLREDKNAIVSNASNNRTCHVSELYFDEAANLINFLNGKKPEGNALDGAQKMRKYITAMAHEMGWITKNNVATKDGDIVEMNDYSNLHTWIEKYGYKHKPFFKYTPKELPTLVSQMEAVHKSRLKK